MKNYQNQKPFKFRNKYFEDLANFKFRPLASIQNIKLFKITK